VLAVVGESGSGKSVTAMTLMGLTRASNARFSGAARLRGKDLITATDEELQRIRGNDVAMIFQDPMTSLNPIYRIGDQIAEQIQAHEEVPDGEARRRVIELLERVGIPRARERVDAYPHEFSGGMRQRVMIAMALSCEPAVLIADEPTTALDVTIQAQILEVMKDLRERMGTAIILVTHDLGVVADIADRIAVMYGGRVVETGTLTRSSTTRSTRTRGGCSARSPASTGHGPSGCRRSPGCRRRSSTRRRAATSARAAGTSSPGARRCPCSRTAASPSCPATATGATCRSTRSGSSA
jgi:peptide/nickel transport system ATP-binding protein/oligopeptide transport system ATP-binding protein